MSIELRSIRCHIFRATREPCTNPAVVEVKGPAPMLLCAKHAAGELDPDPGLVHVEGWEEYGAEKYARFCERALDVLEKMYRIEAGDAPAPDNPVLEMALMEALTYLELYELQRARDVLERKGGRRVETARERERREHWERWQAEQTRRDPSSVLSAVNGYLTEASELLSESLPHDDATAEREREAVLAISQAGIIVARLQCEAGTEDAPPAQEAGPESGAGRGEACA